MTALAITPIEFAARLGLIVLAIGMGLCVYRIVRGPKNADRIIALDLLSILVTAIIVLYAISSGKAAFLDVAIAYALVAFLGTVAFARYLERTASKSRHRSDGRHVTTRSRSQGDTCD